MEDKTLAQTQADWVTHGTIAKMQAQLDREQDQDKRKALEDAIVVQRKRITPG
jgi:hypothetical protein